MSAMEDKITSLLAEGKVFQPPEKGREQAWVKSMEEYNKAYAHSMDDPGVFGRAAPKELVTWDKKWDKVMDCDLSTPEIKWFVGGKLNISTNCLDRHLTDGRRNKAAIIWQGERKRGRQGLHLSDVARRGLSLCQCIAQEGVKRRPGGHLFADGA